MIFILYGKRTSRGRLRQQNENIISTQWCS